MYTTDLPRKGTSSPLLLDPPFLSCLQSLGINQTNDVLLLRSDRSLRSQWMKMSRSSVIVIVSVLIQFSTKPLPVFISSSIEPQGRNRSSESESPNKLPLILLVGLTYPTYLISLSACLSANPNSDHSCERQHHRGFRRPSKSRIDNFICSSRHTI